MRIQSTITEVTPEQWAYFQRTLKTSYTIGENDPRVCLTVQHEGEERHVEMPLGIYAGTLTGMGLSEAMDRFRVQISTAFAALTPDTLPDHLNKARDAADPARKPGQTEAPCEHGSPVLETIPSLFHDERQVRTHADGCQSYGPYGK